jgi:hypothetical protein
MSVARSRFLPLVLLLSLLAGPRAQAISRQLPPAASGRTMRVAFINTLAPSNPLHRGMADIMDATARDLGIDLVQHDAEYWPGLRADTHSTVTLSKGTLEFVTSRKPVGWSTSAELKRELPPIL